jgi:hypothetical protein
MAVVELTRHETSVVSPVEQSVATSLRDTVELRGEVTEIVELHMIGQTIKEAFVAVVYIQEFPIADRTTKNYDFVADKIGDGPFDGLIAHTAGFDDDAGVFRILDVWETREQAERFLAEHVQPLIEQGPATFPNPDNFTEPTRDGFYELHHIVA